MKSVRPKMSTINGDEDVDEDGVGDGDDEEDDGEERKEDDGEDRKEDDDEDLKEDEEVAEEKGTSAGKIAGAECSSRLPPANPVHAACAPGWGPVAIRNRPGLGVSRCPIGRARATQLHRGSPKEK